MSERFLNLRKQFRIGNYNFSLEACKWKSVNFKEKYQDDESNKISSFIIPNIRINQTSLILSNHIYMFGGTSKHMQNQNFCAINLKNNRWHRINAQDNPQSRDSHGMALLQNAIYLFGGSNQNQHFNDLHTFNNFTNSWTKIQNLGQVPEPRDSMILLGIKNYLLLIGGMNLKQNKYFQDVYMWKNNLWTHLMTQNYPKNIVGARSCECSGRIFLFGGINPSSGQYNNKLFQVLVDDQSSINFKQVKLSVQLFPQGRINHQMVPINHQYLMTIGGQKIGKKIFKDIWLFDIYSLKWTRIQPRNGPLRGIHSFSAVFQDNTIYLIGGFLQNRQQISDQVLIIQFANQQIFKSEICEKCHQTVEKRETQSKKYPKDLKISVGFFYNLALQIKFPFHAISMIYQASKTFNPSYFRLKLDKTISNFQYIKIQFDGCSFGLKQFQQFITHKNLSNHVKKLAEQIKLGAFRLGKTFLFVSTDKKYRYVYLLSAESRISPHFDQNYTYYAYVQNIELQRIQTEQGVKQRSFILNILKSYILKPEIVLNIPQRNSLLIFQNKIVMSAEKNYLTELISTQNDIIIWKSEKKIQFLEQRGYNIKQDVQISLRTFMTFYHLNSTEKQTEFYLNDDTQPVKNFKYKNILDNFNQRKLIEKVNLPQIQEIEISGEVYTTESHNLLKNNFGLLIYSNGRLFNRFGIQFGKLLPQHFFKSKYKKASTIFYELGYINIVGLEENMFKNGFVKNQHYCMLLEQIQKVCHADKKNLNLELESNDQFKSIKRVKI